MESPIFIGQWSSGDGKVSDWHEATISIARE
jgi:hypothetical protein